MSTATIQQFGQDLASWLDAAQHGETVAIVDDGREIARLTPPEKKATAPVAPATPLVWPDFAARLKAIYGDRVVMTEEESTAFWDDMRVDAGTSPAEREALDKKFRTRVP